MSLFGGIRLFERGLVYVGTNYLSYPLWDKYIEYEELRAELSYPQWSISYAYLLHACVFPSVNMVMDSIVPSRL
jgi:hypothetical protein